MKATVLVDNIAKEDLQGEWGLCIYIEYEGKKILLDAGGSNLFLTNAQKLGLSIEDVDYAVLSHAHYDHANGMTGFFEHNQKANFFLQETAAENCYSKYLFFYTYIGLPKHILTDYKDRITFAKGDFELMPGVYLIPHKTPGLEQIGKRERMYQRTNKKGTWDNFSHEQSLVFDTDKGLVIFNSCSHGGAVNIVNEVSRTFPDKKVYALIGGFHLFNKSGEEIREVAKKLNDTGVSYVCTGHCTRGRAYNILSETLGDKLHRLHVGLEMEF